MANRPNVECHRCGIQRYDPDLAYLTAPDAPDYIWFCEACHEQLQHEMEEDAKYG